MPLTLTPSHIEAVHKGFTRVGKAPPAGYSPEQILFARQYGYTIPNNYKPGSGLNQSQVSSRKSRKTRKTRRSRK